MSRRDGDLVAFVVHVFRGAVGGYDFATAAKPLHYTNRWLLPRITLALRWDHPTVKLRADGYLQQLRA